MGGKRLVDREIGGWKDRRMDGENVSLPVNESCPFFSNL